MRFNRSSFSSRSAFATAAVFILLLAASALTLTAVGVFRNLHHELRFTEQKQVEHWKQAVVRKADGANTSTGNSTTAPTNFIPAIPKP